MRRVMRLKKSSIQKLGELPNSFFVSTALLVRAIKQNVKITEIPVKHLPRTKGVSTVTSAQIIRAIKDLIKIYLEMHFGIQLTRQNIAVIQVE